jgi:hypothetical protein
MLTSLRPVRSKGYAVLKSFACTSNAPFLRMGLGRLLMSKAETLALCRGVGSVWLTAWSGNHRALSFYKSIGYQDVGDTQYVIEGKSYENRVLSRRLASSGGRPRTFELELNPSQRHPLDAKGRTIRAIVNPSPQLGDNHRL